jgi:hypothetical protein
MAHLNHRVVPDEDFIPSHEETSSVTSYCSVVQLVRGLSRTIHYRTAPSAEEADR